MARWFNWSLSVADPSGCRCLNISTMFRFHTSPHRTGRADFPHPALRVTSLTCTQHAALISVVTPWALMSLRMSRVLSGDSPCKSNRQIKNFAGDADRGEFRIVVGQRTSEEVE